MYIYVYLRKAPERLILSRFGRYKNPVLLLLLYYLLILMALSIKNTLPSAGNNQN